MVVHPSRRTVLQAGAGAALTAPLLAGCSALSVEPDKGSSSGPVPSAGGAREAPSLADKVKAGTLPPLAQRLPENPMVIQPIQEAGQYGGTLRSPSFGTLADPAQSGLVEWNVGLTAQQPGLAEKWEITDGGKTYVFHLRKGLKWSDGHPFTADDLMFVHDHIFANKTLTPAPWTWLTTGGKPVRFDRIDDTTVAMHFGAPTSLLLKNLAFPAQGLTLIKPAHYLQQFHPDFVDKAKLDKLVKDEGAADWPTLFTNKDAYSKNPERPVMGAWVLTEPMSTTSQTMVAERNPYYWKVDPDGRQLPYIDRIRWSQADPENQVLKSANGEYDFNAGLKIADAPVLLEKAEAKNFELRQWQTDGGFMAIYVNQAHPDKELRKLLANIDFRAALSHAINRQEINDALLSGKGTMTHPCGQPGDPYFEEGMGKRFTEYDVAKANQLLDGIGMTRRDGGGMRLRLDGSPLKLQIVAFETPLPVNHIDVYEFVKRYWAKVGIAMDVKVISTDLWYAEVNHGEYPMMGYACVGFQWDIDPLWYVPTNGFTYFAPRFGNWYANPDDKYAEEPTGDIRQLQLLYDQLASEIDEPKRIELGRQILRLHDKNVWIMGTVSPPFVPVVVNKDLVNVQQKDMISYRTGVNIVASQEWFRNPEKH